MKNRGFLCRLWGGGACTLLLGLIVAQSAIAQESEVWKGLQSSFDLPFEELLVKPEGSEWDNALKGMSVRLAYVQPLSAPASRSGAGSQGDSIASGTFQLGLKYTPLGYWFVSSNLYGYADPGSQKPWDPDFSYAFGYDDWHPYTLSLTYANGGGNRFMPSAGESRTRFREGTVSLGWKFNLPAPVERWVVSGYGDAVACSTALGWAPVYSDATTGRQATDKLTANIGCKYSFLSRWYASLTLYYYPDKTQQQAWNPDYTYGFGYFDWRPGRLSFQYNNYSGNRFSRKDRASGTGDFKNGSISVGWSQSW